MKYTFALKKNIHMYTHLLMCTDGQNKYETICESAPRKEETIVFWPDDFDFSPEEKAIFVKELQEWSKSQGFKCIISEGKSH